MKALCVTLLEQYFSILPCGSAYINGSLLAHGYESDNLLLSVKTTKNTEQLFSLETMDEGHISNVVNLTSEIEKYDPDILFLSCYCYNRASTLLVAKKLKEYNPQLIIVGGGPDIFRSRFDSNPASVKAYSPIMDYLIQGEGEHKVISLMKELEKGGDPGILPDTYVCKNLNMEDVGFGAKVRIENLNEIPYPDFGSSLDFKKLAESDSLWGGIPIYMSRGCSGNCTFCNHGEYLNKIKFRSGANIFNEIVTHMTRHDSNHFTVVDDDPLSFRALEEIENLLRLLIAHPHKCTWDIFNARICTKLTDPKWAWLLKEAGLQSVRFGVESFSPSVRKHMQKPSDQEKLKTILRNFSLAGIKANIFIIYGYPTETKNDFQETLESLVELQSVINHVHSNIFILNENYHVNAADTFSFIPKTENEPFSYWKSEHVNPEVMWHRYYQLKEVFDINYKGRHQIASPKGNYSQG